MRCQLHWLDGHEFEWTPGVGDGQGGLACCDQKKILEMISFFKKFSKARFMAQDMIYPGEYSICTWEKGEIHCFGVKCPIDIN